MRSTPACCLLVSLGVLGLQGCAHERLATSEPMRLEAVPFAWGTGGSFQTALAVSPAQWKHVSAAFDPAPANPSEERAAIVAAVHRLQLIACEQTPVVHAMGYSEVDSAGQGRMDCVDCSTATARFLRLLEERGLMRHHAVMEPLWRYAGGMVPVHRSAVIAEKPGGQRWVVDPWLRPYKQPPVIETLEKWKRFEDPEPVIAGQER